MPASNVLFITVDQWRGDCLSAGGHPVVRFGGASHRIGDALPGPAVRYPH